VHSCLSFISVLALPLGSPCLPAPVYLLSYSLRFLAHASDALCFHADLHMRYETSSSLLPSMLWHPMIYEHQVCLSLQQQTIGLTRLLLPTFFSLAPVCMICKQTCKHAYVACLFARAGKFMGPDVVALTIPIIGADWACIVLACRKWVPNHVFALAQQQNCAHG